MKSESFLLSGPEAAKFLGVGSKTFYRWSQSKGFPRPMRAQPGSYPRWRRDHLIAWVDASIEASIATGTSQA